LFGLIDALEKINLRPETKSKIKKTRENFAKTLKEEAEREAREGAADAKLAAKRRAEEERIAKLSAAEQQKVIRTNCLHVLYADTIRRPALGAGSQAQHA
jgi:ATPase subunit of ABC transporter with duplicated ATPase domains